MSKKSKRREQRQLERLEAAAAIPGAGAQHATSGGPRNASLLDRRALITILVTITVATWFAGRFDPQLTFLFAVLYLASGIALGVTSPLAGGAVALLLVPYQGGGEALPFGVAEFFRAAPLWGGVLRLLWESWGPIRGTDDERDARRRTRPHPILVAAAIAVIFLAPLQRFTATALGTFPETNQWLDAMGILGTQSLLYAAWLFGAHLPRPAIRTALLWAAGGSIVAMLIALLAWQEFAPLSAIAFDGRVFGRLASLGYPTPTAMGIAITLPLVAGALWNRSPRLAIATFALGVVIIILTESRGPLLAIGAAIALMVLSARGLSLRTFTALAVASAAAGTALIVNRYGGQLDQLLAGRIPNIGSDFDRITSWVAGVQTAIANPLTGGGWFSVRFWNNGELGANNVNLSHNLILQGLADGGFPLGIAAAIVVVGSSVLMFRKRAQIPLSWKMAALALLVCGLWDMPQLRAYAALMGGLALGLVARGDTAIAYEQEEIEA